MTATSRALVGLCVAGLALGACSDSGSLSGKYVADFEGGKMVINFIDASKATFTMGGDGDGPTLDCTYDKGETLITLNCPGSSGISLTRVDGGLEANMGGMLVRYKKQ
jgi:hypothetical protein